MRDTGDSVVCEVDRVERDEAGFTVTLVRPSPVPFTGLLPTGPTRTVLRVDGQRVEVSVVRPYFGSTG